MSTIILWIRLYGEWAPGEEDIWFPLLPAKVLPCVNSVCVCVCVCVSIDAKGRYMCLVTQLCLTLYDPMDFSLPDSFLHGILQARILE